MERPPGEEATANRKSAILAFLLQLLACLLLTGVWFAIHPHHLFGDLADTRLNNFILEHGHRYLTRQTPSFWDARFFFPYPKSLALSDTHIGSLPIYSAFRHLYSREVAMQGWYWSLSFLNCVCAMHIMRRLGFSWFASLLAGYYYAFGLATFSHLMAVQMNARFCVPMIFYYAWQFRLIPSAKHFLSLSLYLVWQYYLCVYIGFFCCLTLGIAFLLCVIGTDFRRRFGDEWRTTRWYLPRLLGVLILAGLLMSPLIRQYSSAIVKRDLANAEPTLDFYPHPESWIYPSILSRSWAWLDPIIEQRLGAKPSSGHQLFPGLLPLLALGYVFLSRRPFKADLYELAWILGATCLLTMLLMTKVGDYCLYIGLQKIPGVAGIRAITRIILVLMFLLSFSLAWTWDHLPLPTGRARWIGQILLGLLFLTDQSFRLPDGAATDPWIPRRYTIRDAVARQSTLVHKLEKCQGIRLLYVCPPGANPGLQELLETQMDAMLAAQSMGIATINGWSGHPPEGWYAFRSDGTLFHWLHTMNGLSESQIDGLVIVGTMDPSPDPAFDRAIRQKYTHIP